MKSILTLILSLGCVDYSKELTRREPLNVASLSMGRKSMERNGKEYAPLECGVTDTLHYGEYVVIESPNFGEEKYPNKYKCTWKLNIPANSEILFSCDSFDVKKGDYLYYEDTPVKGSKGYFSLDPIKYPDEVTITLQFKTNKKRKGKGFRCFIDSEELGFNPNSTTTDAPLPNPIQGDSCNCGIPNRSNRIIGGVETEKNEYPWQVALVSSKGSHPYCGGTLISNSHVLTAAHCTDEDKSDPKSIAVLVGEHRIDDNKFNRIPVSDINMHPGWDDNTFDNDFSILTLATPVEFSSRVAPACLPSDNSKDFAGEVATLSGWGRLSYQGNQPTVLNEVDVTVKSNEECRGLYGGWITSNMMCAYDLDKYQCNGDSGGPLAVQENGRSTLIGIVSWSIKCSGSVQSRVTEQMDWILENTSGTQLSSCAAGR